jgi:multidrug efflux pump subunit AcrA (membrane-fusion protein)
MAVTAEHPDAFSAVTNLVALLADPKAASARLTELQKQIEKAEAASAKLAADREQHAAAVAAAKAELDARGAALLKRETAAGIKERELIQREKVLEASKPPRFSADPTGAPGTISHSGLAREGYHG